MLTIPPIPSWQGIHPLIVHFPIVLLLIAPLFIVIGAMLNPVRGFPFLLVSLILMALGTISTFAAASSGEAAAGLAQHSPQAKQVLCQHQELAETTETAFSALTLIFASILFVPRLLRREPNQAISTILPLIFLMFYATGAISVVNTAHQGGRLVHELGITTQMPHGAAVESARRQ